MKTRLLYVFILFLTIYFSKGQIRSFHLSNANSQVFNGHLYVFGTFNQKASLTFYIYKLDSKLNILDSLSINSGKSGTENYLQSYSDTLHDYLNIYLQKKETRSVTVFRLTKKFELLATLENVGVARLNNTTLFGNEFLYFKNTVYAIKTEQDTSGKQFYVNKYQLKSEKENFDYEFKWQFPFERKNIHSAHIFFANKSHVFLHVTVHGGSRSGEWILKLKSETGQLEKATKLNDKGETHSYQFGSFMADQNYKSLALIGQKFTEAQFSRKDSKLAIANSAILTLYYMEIDSLGEISIKQDFKIPLKDLVSDVKKTANSFLLRLNIPTKRADGTIFFTGDLFKGVNSKLCYLYSNTHTFNLIPSEDRLALEKTVLGPNLQIEDYYQSADKLDMNGKLCIDSLNQFEKLFYMPITFPVNQRFKLDPEKNPLWILSKHTFKKNNVNYSFLGPVKKIYKITSIEDISESQYPSFIDLPPGSFIISSQPEEGTYQLKLYNW